MSKFKIIENRNKNRKKSRQNKFEIKIKSIIYDRINNLAITVMLFEVPQPYIH